MLIQYLDVEGPNSGPIYSYLRVLERDFGENLSFAVRHLPSTEDAWAAAAALEAASKQGRFLDFLAALEDNRSDPVAAGSRANTSIHQRQREIARDLGLDLARFDADVADPRTMQQVEADRTEAHRAGVERGSTFFLLDGKSRQVTSFDGFREQVADAVRPTPNGATRHPVGDDRPQH
ncbi:Thioredoxin [Arthrobacter subterraneus]|uniref:Thioredoxin n=2 Tax=Arthrobacter subterraneus TaxID=335973 RepID=A0A1G8NXU1_9MICC|nr:Thioredoxin [Arthrobacter subterraneus]